MTLRGVWEPRIHRQMVRSMSGLSPLSPKDLRLASDMRRSARACAPDSLGIETPGSPRQSRTVHKQVEWKQGNRPPGAQLWDAVARSQQTCGGGGHLQAPGLRRTLSPGPLIWELGREPGSQTCFPGSALLPRPGCQGLVFSALGFEGSLALRSP